MEKLEDNQNWYIVYTRPGKEKKVTELLRRKRIQHYCPVNKVESLPEGSQKYVREPLFKSYVFVRVSYKRLLSVRKTEGVINLVYWLDRPAIIDDGEIDTIKKILHSHPSVQIERTQVNLNENVKVIKGSSGTAEGNVIQMLSNSIRVLLPSLGYAMVAHSNKAHIDIPRLAAGTTNISTEPVLQKVQ